MKETAFALAQELSRRFTGRAFMVVRAARLDGSDSYHVLGLGETRADAPLRLAERLRATSITIAAEYTEGLLKT